MPNSSKVIVGADELARMLQAIVGEVTADPQRDAATFAVIGIRDKGALLGRTLTTMLSKRLKTTVPYGMLDIGLYRDDVGSVRAPVIRATEIDFDVDGRDILLVDDVLHTGRTIRAALDAIMDFGRPRRIQLAVLVDRAGRELPIAADFVGRTVTEVAPGQRVRLEFDSNQDMERVLLDTPGE